MHNRFAKHNPLCTVTSYISQLIPAIMSSRRMYNQDQKQQTSPGLRRGSALNVGGVSPELIHELSAFPTVPTMRGTCHCCKGA